MLSTAQLQQFNIKFNISTDIRKWADFVEPERLPEKVLKFEDLSTVIYPKNKQGQTIRVVITRRLISSSHGARIKLTRCGSKEYYSIKYAFGKKFKSMDYSKFIAEIKRMGAAHLIDLLIE